MKHLSLLLASLLIAGTSIGVGILVFPVITAEAGFIPSLSLFVILGAIFAWSGIALTDAFLAHPTTPNLLSLTKHLCGKTTQMIIGALYLILLYSLIVAYVGLSGTHISTFLEGKISSCIASYTVALGIGIFLWNGTPMTSRVNGILMTILICSYLILIGSGLPHLDIQLLEPKQWNALPSTIPVLLTSFGYHPVIPSLIPFLGGERRTIRKAIILGSLLTFFLYALWEVVLLGIIPLEGSNGLLEAREKGQDILVPLYYLTQQPLVRSMGVLFAFVAILTSFIGVALGLLEVILDILPVRFQIRNRSLGVFLTLLPPTIVATTYPEILITVLEWGAAPAVFILLVILPFFLRYMAKKTKIAVYKS
jgi:tyrosine-specific transport protein